MELCYDSVMDEPKLPYQCTNGWNLIFIHNFIQLLMNPKFYPPLKTYQLVLVLELFFKTFIPARYSYKRCPCMSSDFSKLVGLSKRELVEK